MIEVLLLDLTMSSIMPLLVTAVTAHCGIIYANRNGCHVCFTLLEQFTLDRIPYVVLLGILCGLISLCYPHDELVREYIP